MCWLITIKLVGQQAMQKASFQRFHLRHEVAQLRLEYLQKQHIQETGDIKTSN